MRSVLILVVLAACGGTTAGSEPAAATTAPATTTAAPAPAPAAAPAGIADVGPDGPADLAVPAVTISTDHEDIEAGEKVFTEKGCPACHQFGSKLVGPDLNNVTDRRTPTWIARMVRYPEQMTKQDPQAKKLFGELMVQMSNQGVADDQLVPLIAYLHSKSAPQEAEHPKEED